MKRKSLFAVYVCCIVALAAMWSMVLRAKPDAPEHLYGGQGE